MGLEEEIKKEEEELKKLEEAENEEENNQDDTDEGGDDEDENNDASENDDDSEGDEGEDDDDDDDTDDDGEGDDDDADDDSDDGEGDADDKHKGVKKKDAKSENDAAAKARIERKKRLKAEERAAALEEKLNNQGDKDQIQDDNGGDKEETADEKLARLEAAEEQRQQQQLREQAADELAAIEDEYMEDPTNADYKAASTHMIKAMYQAVTHLNPGISQKKAIAEVQNKVLQIASAAARKNQNPAEVLHQMAYDNYGFDPNVKPPGKKKTNAADNLKKKAKNKKRSANGLTGGGQTAGARVTIEEADNMSLSDFGNMSDAEIDELIAQAGE